MPKLGKQMSKTANSNQTNNTKQQKFCPECGYNLQSHTHSPNCSHYKKPKQPKPCPECGSIYGHKKTCSKYNKKPCPECGSVNGHFDWCSHSKGRCKYCGYSLRSNRHSPSCPLYDKEKADKRESLYQKTMMSKYGITNAYFLPGHAKKMITAANNAENSIHISKINIAIANRLKEFGVSNVEFEYKLGDHWYDLYCENNSHRLLIERNPSVSHNYDYDFMYLTGKTNKNKGGKDKRYHLDLSLNAESNGLEVVHWFDHVNEDKMYDLILSKLGMNSRVLYARKCCVKEISAKEAVNFINKNHILNITKNPPINIGLFYGEELVSIMSFCELKDNKSNSELCGGTIKNCYELLRYCNIYRTTIVGGAAKLHKYFISKYNPRYIKTLSDYNLGNGKLYENLGYNKIGSVRPSCFG